MSQPFAATVALVDPASTHRSPIDRRLGAALIRMRDGRLFRLYYLLSLRRTLECLPSLRDAFLDGRLTLKQAILLGKVVTPATVSTWIRRAEEVTLRRLEDEVELWSHLREARPDVWELLEGGPLPEELSLVPGRAPRLHASASSSRCEREGTSGRPPLTAESFLRALESGASTSPLPRRMCRIRMRVEPGVKAM